MVDFKTRKERKLIQYLKKCGKGRGMGNKKSQIISKMVGANGPDGRCFLAAWAVSKSVH